MLEVPGQPVNPVAGLAEDDRGAGRGHDAGGVLRALVASTFQKKWRASMASAPVPSTSWRTGSRW